MDKYDIPSFEGRFGYMADQVIDLVSFIEDKTHEDFFATYPELHQEMQDSIVDKDIRKLGFLKAKLSKIFDELNSDKFPASTDAKGLSTEMIYGEAHIDILKPQKGGLRIIDWILNYINSREKGDGTSTMRAYKYLQKKLGSSFEEVLMKHGDPDAPNKFREVVSAWEDEAWGTRSSTTVMEKYNHLERDVLLCMLNETGEMSQDDIEPGGDWYDYVKDLSSRVRRAGFSGKAYPFDQYQGPYFQIPELGAKVWGTSGEDGFPLYYVETDMGMSETVPLNHLGKYLKTLKQIKDKNINVLPFKRENYMTTKAKKLLKLIEEITSDSIAKKEFELWEPNSKVEMEDKFLNPNYTTTSYTTHPDTILSNFHGHLNASNYPHMVAESADVSDKGIKIKFINQNTGKKCSYNFFIEGQRAFVEGEGLKKDISELAPSVTLNESGHPFVSFQRLDWMNPHFLYELFGGPMMNYPSKVTNFGYPEYEATQYDAYGDYGPSGAYGE